MDVKVLGFAGSLRKDSYNRAALQAAQELLPQGMTMEICDLAPIPLFNEDVEQGGISGRGSGVQRTYCWRRRPADSHPGI